MKLSTAKLTLGLVGLVVFANALFNTFVWDDRGYIFENAYMPGFNLVKLFSANTFNSSGYYRPLAAVYFSALFNLFGNAYFMYHLIQLSMHIVVAYLVYELLAEFIKPKISLFLALIFLVHPIQVESVAYIGASQSELFTLFGLLGLWFLRHKPKAYGQLITVLFFTLSLFVKEVGFLFFILGFLYVWLIRRQWNWRLLLPLLATLGLYLWVRLGLAGIPLQQIEIVRISQLPLFVRLLSVPKIIFYYLQTLVLPVNLAVNQHWTVRAMNLSEFWLPLAVSILFFTWLSVGVIHAAVKKLGVRPYLFFLIWFLLGLGMLLQIFPLDMTVADRWFYFPFIGLLGFIGLVLNTIRFTKSYSEPLKYISIVLLVTLSIRTIVRNSNYQSDFVLYTHDLKINYDYNLLNDLAMEYLRKGETKTALDLFQKSVAIYPFDINISNLGAAYDVLGSSDSGRLYLERSLSEVSYDTYPHRHLPVVYFNYINFLMRYGELQTVVDFINTQALSDYPDNALFFKLLAINEYRLGRIEAAKSAIIKSRKLLPGPETESIYQKIILRQTL